MPLFSWTKRRDDAAASWTRLRSVGAISATGLVLVLAGCGGDDNGDDGNGDAGETVSAEAFADSVCGGFGTWVETIQTSAEGLTSALEEAGSDPEAAKDTVVTLLSDASEATDELSGTIADAGVPDVENGEEAAAAVADGIDNVKGVFDEARGTVEEADADDPSELISTLSDISSSFGNEALSEAFAALEEVDSSELDEAFDGSEVCQGIG